MQTAYQDRGIFPSTTLATRGHHTAAVIVVAVATIIFVVAAPFAQYQFAAMPALIATYQSALAISDILIATSLFAQFALLRLPALLWLACGYLFIGALAQIHPLVFPGLYAPDGLLGAGQQTAPWLYIVWHGALPLSVLGYAAFDNATGEIRTRAMPWPAIALSVIASVVAAGVSVLIVIAMQDRLPSLLAGDHALPSLTAIVSGIWCLTLVALVVIARRRPHSVLDIWLMVALWAWLLGLALASLLSAGRYDLGYYAGRLIEQCAAGAILAALLIEQIALQARLSGELRQTRQLSARERERHSTQEQLFRAVVESSNDAIITKSLDGIITSWNAAAERLFSYSATEAIGQHIRLIVPPQRHTEIDRILVRIAQGEHIAHHETSRMRKNGELLDVSLSISPILNTEGLIVGASKVVRDITETKRTERALSREAEERHRIFETSQDLILMTDLAGQFVQVSPSVTAILGYRPDEMIGRDAADFADADDVAAVLEELRGLRQGGRLHGFETRLRHKDGHSVSLNWSATWSEPVQRHFFIGRDLTEKQAAEAQLRQVQKMEAIGHLTGGVAHDFNNILTVITGAIGLLAESVAHDQDLAMMAKLIDDAADRGAQLTQQLLAFARKQPLQPIDLDANVLIADAAKLLRSTLGANIEISPVLDADAWAAVVDPSQLTTAILNLALNARDAMPNGGKLTLETRNVTLDGDYAHTSDEVVAGDYVMIAVSDTGCGIPADQIDKVFEPFFSTKGVGKGSGLGLSMVFGFVKQSGGHIQIYSEVGHGTSVKLYLPRSDAAGPTTRSAALRDVEGGKEKILIVEDDRLVRTYVVAQVKSLGYATLAAANAAEAMDILEQDDKIDLLFTDIVMPGAMNGRQLADAALKRRPGLKTLFTSGYTENAVVHHGRLDAGVLLLAKPYRKPDLAKMLRVALGG